MKQANRYLSILVLFFCVLTPFAVFAEASKEDAIQEIKSHFDRINEGIEQFDHVQLLLNNFSSNGTLLDGYLKDGIVQMIKVEALNKKTQQNEIYYFNDGQVVFVFRKKLRYDRPYGKIIETKVDRFFFLGDKLINYLDEAKEKMNKAIESSAKSVQHESVLFAKALKQAPGPVDFRDLEKAE